MTDIEIPLGRRTKLYRFFEMLPAIISYGSILLLVVLSLISPPLAAFYLLAIIITTLLKAFGIAYHTIIGRNNMEKASKTNWSERLNDIKLAKSGEEIEIHDTGKTFQVKKHARNLERIRSSPDSFPNPEDIRNAVIIATYNESYDILKPTIQSLMDTTYNKENLIVILAYEERGGEDIEKTAKRLQKEYRNSFGSMLLVKHPTGIPDEIIGKGSNITYAGFYLKDWLKDQGIKYQDVIVTTLDADNRTHPVYFDYVTYEYVVHEDRKNLSYQPICLFTNNIWDVPAPMRVVAVGNSFWNVISSMRPHTIRNFASHSQPMDALAEMDFWSKRTIVEDGHQYWRSYFHFDGEYGIVPLAVPIYVDAVLTETYVGTLKAQFIQLRRWAYGASDVPFVATRIFTRNRTVPLGPALARLVRLLDGHVTLACVAILIAVGGWIPLFLNSQAAHSIAAHNLPVVVSRIQQVALVGIFVAVFLSFKILPPRPLRYKRHRNLFMVLQWVLMPFTSIVYSSASAFTSQTALLIGKYFDKFDVTEKAVRKPKDK